MTKFVITEKQVRIVEYHVEAETEVEARDVVGAMDVNDYDVLVDVPATEIISTEARS